MSKENKSVYNFERNRNYLVLTNAYPSAKDLYRNAFVHRRVKNYQANGLNINVFTLDPKSNNKKYNFDDVKVYKGNREDLYNFLLKNHNKYNKILIHFVSPEMIDAIQNVCPHIPIIIWIHGFEAEAWHRRWFNFLESKERLEDVLKKADGFYKEQMKLMNWLYQTKELDLKFVHISNWFKTHVAECDARAKTQNATIIPNVIDDELFNYEERKPDDRLKILSIRPYASRKYANDLSVSAVIELSERPYFDKLSFAFYGDGKYFEETLRPIKDFPNVKIVQGFLKQQEIADVHKKYGVFLCPTRWDSQGVSMCEAMSSGLVPISTNITAIPEFVTHRSSGLLARPEDPVHIADLIESLYFDSALFEKLSRNATIEIRNKCAQDVVINKELELIQSD